MWFCTGRAEGRDREILTRHNLQLLHQAQYNLQRFTSNTTQLTAVTPSAT